MFIVRPPFFSSARTIYAGDKIYSNVLEITLHGGIKRITPVHTSKEIPCASRPGMSKEEPRHVDLI